MKKRRVLPQSQLAKTLGKMRKSKCHLGKSTWSTSERVRLGTVKEPATCDFGKTGEITRRTDNIHKQSKKGSPAGVAPGSTPIPTTSCPQVSALCVLFVA